MERYFVGNNIYITFADVNNKQIINDKNTRL